MPLLASSDLRVCSRAGIPRCCSRTHIQQTRRFAAKYPAGSPLMRLPIAAGHLWRPQRGQAGGYALTALRPRQSIICRKLRRVWWPAASYLAACCAKRAGLLRQAWWLAASGLVACCAKRAGLLCRVRWAALIMGAYAADTFGTATGHGLTIKGDAQISRNPSVSGGAYRHVSAIWYHTWAVRTLRAWRNW